MFGPGHPTRVYALSARPGVDSTPGEIESTGRALDVAVHGKGWIAVQGPDGSEAYTRAGDLRISPNGILETGAGHPVLGNGGPIAIPPAESLEIGRDGTISIRPQGQPANTLATLDRIKLVAPGLAELVKGEDGLFRTVSGVPAPPDASVQVVSGAIEGSNVNMVGALVEMISLSRRFEMQVKLMDAAREDDEVVTQILRMS